MNQTTRHPRFPLVPGIAGGLGPHAHLWLERRLLELAVERFGAGRDADFPDWVVSSMPQTPDRTEALAGRGSDPTPFLLRTLERLRDAGADFAAIACNTIHAFLPRLVGAPGSTRGRTGANSPPFRQDAEAGGRSRREIGIAQRRDWGNLPLPVVHVVCETVRFLRERHPGVRRAGLLATEGTCRSGLFGPALAEAGIDLVCPPREMQDELVTAAIYGPRPPQGVRAGGIKGGSVDRGDPSPRQLLHRAGGRLVEDFGAQAILVACSEISLAVRPGEAAVPVVDTMDVLAGAVLDLASGQRALDSLAGPDRWPQPIMR